jgi:putative oxidoreductase
MTETLPCFERNTRCRDAGWLVLRFGIGATFLFVHGGPKLLAGPEKWTQLGGAMGLIGITFAPVFWGFMAAISETLGGLLLMLGAFVRPAALLMFITMTVASIFHHSRGESLMHPLELAIVFLALLVGGEGRYALGCRIRSCFKRNTSIPPDVEQGGAVAENTSP